MLYNSTYLMRPAVQFVVLALLVAALWRVRFDSSARAGGAAINPAVAPGTAPEGWPGFPAARSGWAARTATCRMRCRRTWSPSTASGWTSTPVTNAQFQQFVQATNYVTVAERPLDPKDFPGVPRDKLVPGSAVFQPTTTPVRSTIRCSGGATRRARTGSSRKGPAAR